MRLYYGIPMTDTDLKQTLKMHSKWLRGEAEGERADLRHADLRRADLRRANLQGADLRHATLYGADLRRADLQGANLRYATLRRADLRYATLHGADLQGANLRRADLRHATLQGAVYSWQSHSLIAETLRQAAGDSISRRSLAGLILVSHDWCWDVWDTLDHPERAWALDVLRGCVQDGDEAPEILKGTDK